MFFLKSQGCLGRDSERWMLLHVDPRVSNQGSTFSQWLGKAPLMRILVCTVWMDGCSPYQWRSTQILDSSRVPSGFCIGNCIFCIDLVSLVSVLTETKREYTLVALTISWLSWTTEKWSMRAGTSAVLKGLVGIMVLFLHHTSDWVQKLKLCVQSSRAEVQIQYYSHHLHIFSMSVALNEYHKLLVIS